MNPANHTVYHTPPSISVLLSELPGIDGGSKVRFLGCVNSYNIRTAILNLVSRYPSPPEAPAADVQISHVLADASVETLQVGAWVNVIGYVAYPPQVKKRVLDSASAVKVQAVLLWSAGSASVAQPCQYEEALLSKRAAMGAMAQARKHR